MTDDTVLDAITQFFCESAESDSFNGMTGAALRSLVEDEETLKQDIIRLVIEGKITCVFQSTSVNPHIKRLPDLTTEEQVEKLNQEKFGAFCAYPTSHIVKESCDLSIWNNRPFSKQLMLVEPQLSFRAFDMGVLERYANDPRYIFRFEDYMGYMSISDDPFFDESFPERDKVSLRTFGLGFDDSHTPHTIVFLRYLAELSPEHQQYWNSYLVGASVKMSKPYFQASIQGEFWKNRSVRHAIMEELKVINEQTNAIWGRSLFRELPVDEVPVGLTYFLRPTTENFHRFILALDKMLSENIDSKFFNQQIPLERETTRSDGRVELHRKGSIALLEEWLLKEISWNDTNEFKQVIIEPLRNVRKLRQAPAHKFTKDNFSIEYFDRRKKILWSVFNSLSNIRSTLGTHPEAKEIQQPAWLDQDKIDVF